MNARKRVVLLTRPGSARDRTEAAIAEAGADVAAVLDPGVASEADVRNAAPDAVLVILDPATEQALSSSKQPARVRASFAISSGQTVLAAECWTVLPAVSRCP